MKKFFSKLLLFLPAILFLVFVNFKVDPARLFKPKTLEKKIAKALVSGSAVTDFMTNSVDGRALAGFLIDSLKHKRDIAVFGSSRVFVISSDLFPNRTLLNNAIWAPPATLDDLKWLYGLYQQRNMVPDTVIIGVDPWLFDAGSKSTFFLDRLQNLIPYRFQQLFSISYFQASLNSLHSHLKNFSATSQNENENKTILPDGSWTPSKAEREISIDEVRNQILQQDSRHEDMHADFSRLDKGLTQEFIDFVQKMENDGVKVIIYLPPYNPVVYDFHLRSDQYKIVQETENFLKQTAYTHHWVLKGSYDPHQLSIPECFFYDDLHLKDDAPLKKVLSL